MEAFDDFTESAYRALVERARARYTVLDFAAAREAEAGVLWRHDIDVSVHRARSLATIEHGAGLRAVYFVYPHSRFYNAFEGEVVAHLRAIAALGHGLGVHFDPHVHGLAPGDRAALARAVRAEAEALEFAIGVAPEAVSFHDPDIGGWTGMDDDEVGGLPSAYGRSIRERFAYCSDSNGHWRFTPLAAVLADGGHERLHVLTHPEWWVPEPLSPRARIARAIEGRAAAVSREYDNRLAALGRDNLR